MSDRDRYPSPARLWRKIYWRIIPVVSIAWLCSSIDRGSLGYVAVPLSKDLGLSATNLGFAAGVVFVGYIVVPVPAPAGHIHGAGRSASPRSYGRSVTSAQEQRKPCQSSPRQPCGR
jgi:hypothetical protein